MSDKRVLYTADLYCGAGGFTAGLHAAAENRGIELRHVAVNHWDVAINTHSRNFPDAVHFRESMETIDPRKAVPGGHLDILVASPECTYFSRARGGRPMSDQSRATAWHILRWCESLYVDHLILENVQDWKMWGPLHPCTCGAGENSKEHKPGYECLRPIKSQMGATFRRWVSQLRGLDYVVDHRMLCSANYGGATTRTRFFLQARRIHSKRSSKARPKITWPESTHVKPGTDKLGLWPDARPWRAAREIIDWSIEGQSIYGRRKPLAPNTMRRIYAGLKKFSGIPFIVGSGDSSYNIDELLTTITTAKGGEFAVVEPSIIPVTHQGGQDRAYSINEPLNTVTGARRGEFGLSQPFLVVNRTHADTVEIHQPITTLTTSKNMEVPEPFIVAYYGEREGQDPRVASVDDPLQTVCSQRTPIIVEPMIIPQFGEGAAKHVDEPLGVITTTSRGIGVAEPFLSKYHGSHVGNTDGDNRNLSIDEPIPTLDTSNRVSFAQPYLIKFNGTGGAASIDQPIDTLTTKDRFALVHPELVRSGKISADSVIGYLDIRFRMLKVRELARAMGFDDAYVFTGNIEDQVKQIGNAVSKEIAEALSGHVIDTGCFV